MPTSYEGKHRCCTSASIADVHHSLTRTSFGSSKVKTNGTIGICPNPRLRSSRGCLGYEQFNAKRRHLDPNFQDVQRKCLCEFNHVKRSECSTPPSHSRRLPDLCRRPAISGQVAPRRHCCPAAPGGMVGMRLDDADGGAGRGGVGAVGSGDDWETHFLFGKRVRSRWWNG